MKKNKDMLRGFFLGVILTALIVSIPAAVATSAKRSIDVVYSDIRIVVDGKEVTPKDVNGNVVEPFAYNGTTFLPLRAAVNAITGGTKPVDWDQKTHTIYIGERPVQEIVDMATLKTYPNNAAAFKTDETFEVRQKPYSPFNVFTNNHSTFLLDGNYTMLHASAAVPDNRQSTGYVAFVDPDSKEELLRVDVNKGEDPVEVALDVTGLDKININYSGGAWLYNVTLTPIPWG